MECPDLRKPRKPIKINGQWISFNRSVIEGSVYYLPKGLSWNAGGFFRINVKGETIYVYRRRGSSFEDYLKVAWDRWRFKRWTDEAPKKPTGVSKTIDTGCPGVIISIRTLDMETRNIRVELSVTEFINNRIRGVYIAGKKIERLNQAWLDESLKKAIAVRRTYEQKTDENYGKPVLVRSKELDPAHWPKLLPRKVFVSEVKDRVAEVIEAHS